MNLKLLTKPQCHLCAAARDTMNEITGEYDVAWEEISTTDHPELAEQFAEEIPVLFVDDRQRDFWVIDPDRLRRMIAAGLDAWPSNPRRRNCLPPRCHAYRNTCGIWRPCMPKAPATSPPQSWPKYSVFLML